MVRRERFKTNRRASGRDNKQPRQGAVSCTTSHRWVSRLENEAVLDRMAARLKARPDILARRRETVAGVSAFPPVDDERAPLAGALFICRSPGFPPPPRRASSP